MPSVRRTQILVGDVVRVTSAYKWHDGFRHIIARLSPEIGSYNFACAPRIAHARCTLAKAKGAPTCMGCLAAE